MQFIKDLKKLGLKDKEAAVFLAALELGPSPAQIIARKAKLVRATTYVVLEGLMQKGLVTEYKEGKKTLFAAEPPRQLMRLLEKQRETLDAKQNEIEHILPELQMLMKSLGGKPSVRYFEGLEGLRSIRREMLMYCSTGDVWYNVTPADHLYAIFPKEEVHYIQQRIAKGIKSMTIFATRSDAVKKEWLQIEDRELVERRFVSLRSFPSTAGMTIYRDRVAIGSFTGTVGGFVLESKGIADMLRQVFLLAWETAKAS